MLVISCRKNKGPIFFVRANRIDGDVGYCDDVSILVRASRNDGDVGCCDDVSIFGSGGQMAALTSSSKGNWHMVISSSGNTTKLWLLV